MSKIRAELKEAKGNDVEEAAAKKKILAELEVQPVVQTVKNVNKLKI